MTILQKDISINMVRKDGKFDYQLIIKGDPVKEEVSDRVYDFGLVNIQSEGKVTMELYKNAEGINESDLLDPDTFIVPISSKIT